jgi:hypothetical protein
LNELRDPLWPVQFKLRYYLFYTDLAVGKELYDFPHNVYEVKIVISPERSLEPIKKPQRKPAAPEKIKRVHELRFNIYDIKEDVLKLVFD